ncbi:MAG: hypothetical protein NT019_00500 [Candidatus Adlerbacteria bacterium]|nr:hypothetical protein [Candidatus Adlerbacteria bacterium]
MRAFRLYVPAISVIAVFLLYVGIGQTYADTMASIGASLCALYLCGLSILYAGVPHPKEWKPSQWLLVAFVFVVLCTTIFSGNFLHAFFGFALDMTSGGFIVLMCILALFVGGFSRVVRQGLFIASTCVLVGLLVYPYLRTEQLVRPSLTTTLRVESAAYTDLGGKVLVAGIGPSAFTYAWQKYRPGEVLATPFWNEDFSVGSGLLPTLLVECGAIAVLLFTLSFFSAVAEEFLQVITRTYTMRRRVVVLASVAVIFFALALLVYAEPSAPLLLAVAVAFGSCRYEDSIGLRVRPLLRTILFGVIAVLTVGVLYLGLSAAFYFYAYASMQQQDLLHARSAGEYAYALSPTGQTDRLLAQILRSSGHALGNAAASQTQVGQLFHRASIYARAATVTEGANAQSWKLLGITLAEEMSLAPSEDVFYESKAAFERAHAESPNDPSVLFFQAQLYILAGQKQQAGDTLQAALALRPTYTEASDLLAAVKAK